MSSDRPSVLLAGATGRVGGGVARALHEAGFWVRALARDPQRLANPALYDDVFIGHATRPATLNGMCDGVDAVFSSIGISSFARRPGLWEVDYQANLNLLDQATAAGVEHFLFLSVLHAERAARVSPLADARNRVARAIIASGLDYNIFEATVFFHDLARYLGAARKRGVVRLFRDGGDLVNPLSALDLGEEVARVIRDRSLRNRVRSVGGSETLSYRQIAEFAFQAAGRPARIKTTPPWVLGLLAAVVRPFNPNMHALLRYFEFAAGTRDGRSEPIGTRRVGPYLHQLAAGKAAAEAEQASGYGFQAG